MSREKRPVARQPLGLTQLKFLTPGNRADGQSNRPPTCTQPPPTLLCDLLIGRNQQNIVQCDQCLLLPGAAEGRFGYRGNGCWIIVIVSKNCSSSSRLVPLRKFSNSGTSRCKGKARSRVKSRSERRACCKNASLDNVLFIGAYMFLNDLRQNSLIGGWNGGYRVHFRLLEMVVNRRYFTTEQ